MGQGGFLQLLSRSLPPCRRYNPAGMERHSGQLSLLHSAFARKQTARLPGLVLSRPYVRLFSLRPSGSLPSRGWFRQQASSHRFPSSLLLKLHGSGSCHGRLTSCRTSQPWLDALFNGLFPDRCPWEKHSRRLAVALSMAGQIPNWIAQI